MRFTEDGKRDYSTSEMLIGNAALAVWILFGTAAVGLFNVFAAVAFLLVSAFLVFYELGKKGCLSCYYCKTCSIGIGKLPDLFFSNEGIKNLNKNGRRLLPYVFLLLSVVPIVASAVAVWQEFSVLKAVLLAGVLAFSVVSAVTMRVRRLRP
jgi:hypothetical protein